MNTTLKQIKAHNPCESSYKKLLKGLNKTKADSENLEFRSIYNILDADDLFWSIKVLDKKTRVHVGALFADTIKHLTEDKRVHDCIEVCFRYARGEATEEELKNAADAVYDARATAITTTAARAAATAADAGTAAGAARATATAAAYAATAAAYAAYADVVADAVLDAATAVVYTATANKQNHKDKLALIFLTYIEEI